MCACHGKKKKSVFELRVGGRKKLALQMGTAQVSGSDLKMLRHSTTQ